MDFDFPFKQYSCSEIQDNKRKKEKFPLVEHIEAKFRKYLEMPSQVKDVYHKTPIDYYTIVKTNIWINKHT